MENNWTVRPILMWPGAKTKRPRRSAFKASWSQTSALLRCELAHLRATQPVIELEVSEGDCRNDGWLRASARPRSPGVIVSFGSKHGPLRYPCDTFTDWQHNVRAIALGLEALRKVDRYGIAALGQQYTGFAQLPGPVAEAPDLDASAGFLSRCTDNAISASDILHDPDAYRKATKLARRNMHPDGKRRDNHEDFLLVQSAARLIGKHLGIE